MCIAVTTDTPNSGNNIPVTINILTFMLWLLRPAQNGYYHYRHSDHSDVYQGNHHPSIYYKPRKYTAVVGLLPYCWGRARWARARLGSGACHSEWQGRGRTRVWPRTRGRPSGRGTPPDPKWLWPLQVHAAHPYARAPLSASQTRSCEGGVGTWKMELRERTRWLNIKGVRVNWMWKQKM